MQSPFVRDYLALNRPAAALRFAKFLQSSEYNHAEIFGFGRVCGDNVNSEFNTSNQCSREGELV